MTILLRRDIMKMIGFSPVIGQSAIKQVATTLASPTVALGASLPAGSTLPTPASPFVSKLQELLNAAEQERTTTSMLRDGNVDPDIEVLKSVSRVNKIRMQKDRDRAVTQLFMTGWNIVYGRKS